MRWVRCVVWKSRLTCATAGAARAIAKPCRPSVRPSSVNSLNTLAGNDRRTPPSKPPSHGVAAADLVSNQAARQLLTERSRRHLGWRDWATASTTDGAGNRKMTNWIGWVNERATDGEKRGTTRRRLRWLNLCSHLHSRSSSSSSSFPLSLPLSLSELFLRLRWRSQTAETYCGRTC